MGMELRLRCDAKATFEVRKDQRYGRQSETKKWIHRAHDYTYLID
jgi:hypothetical protein